MPTKKVDRDIASINIASGLKSRSKKEELAYNHPGHMHEYVFQQTLANFHWEMLDLYMEACKHPLDYSPLIFLAPRNHAKTTLFAETVPLYRIGRNNSDIGQIISSVDSLAKARVKRVGACIQNSTRYRNLSTHTM